MFYYRSVMLSFYRNTIPLAFLLVVSCNLSLAISPVFRAMYSFFRFRQKYCYFKCWDSRSRPFRSIGIWTKRVYSAFVCTRFSYIENAISCTSHITITQCYAFSLMSKTCKFQISCHVTYWCDPYHVK